MSQAGVVADCDAMNFVLVHLGLRASVEALLIGCDWHIATLDAIYRKEAQAALRGEIDALKGRCELVELPTRRVLEKKQAKRWRQIDELARQRFRVVSENDRALLFEASDRGILLVSGDGPLRRLAQERDHVVLDVLDVIEILHARAIIDDPRRDVLLTREAARLGVGPETLRTTLVERGQSHWPCAA